MYNSLTEDFNDFVAKISLNSKEDGCSMPYSILPERPEAIQWISETKNQED